MAENGILFETRPQHPGKYLKRMLADRGWSQDELALVVGRRRQTISDIIAGNGGVTADMALALAAAFGNSASDWLKWDAAYRLSKLDADVSDVEKKAKLFAAFPVRDMQKRGWIKDTADPANLEAELLAFFEVEDLGIISPFPAAMRRSDTHRSLNPAETAWCWRARKLAAALPVGPFTPERLAEAESKLRRLAAYPKEARHLPGLLAEYGVRFVVVEPLAGARIDGAAFWVKDSPAIAISLRYDRIDAFWFTVMHEWAHIRHGHADSFDSDLVGERPEQTVLVETENEQIANAYAAKMLFPGGELESFIGRVGPLYSKQRIIQFAHRVKIHPGIVVGQLQKRNEVSYSVHRDLLAKVKTTVIESALTDGWNQSVAPGVV